MNRRTVERPVSAEVRTGRFLVHADCDEDGIGAIGHKHLATGKVSLAYTGGGTWLALCVDSEFARSSTIVIQVKRDGTVVTRDRVTNMERTVGKLALGCNGVPSNSFEVDLLQHFSEIRNLLAGEIAEVFAEEAAAPVAEVEFSMRRGVDLSSLVSQERFI